MILRPALIHDAPQLLPLLKQLGYPQTDESMHNRLNIYLSSPDYAVLVAEENNMLLGVIALIIQESFMLQERRCRIEALVVDEKARGKGVGATLLKAAELHAKQTNCAIIELTSGAQRTAAHEFYKKYGYTNDKKHAKVYLRKHIL
jgi:GNAT superfamily N-acetyltransferase